MIKKIINYIKIIFFTRLLLKQLLPSLNGNSKKKIYFNSVRTLPNHFITEINLAIILIKSGYLVEIILDDGIFEHIDTEFYSSKPKYYYKITFKLAKLRRKIDFLLWNFLLGKITHYLIFKRVSAIHNKVSKPKIELDFPKRLGFIKSSMIRFFNNEIWERSNLSIWYEQITRKNVLISEDIGLYVENKIKDNDLFVTSHGIYSVWGPAYNEVKDFKKKIVYAANIYRISTLQFFNNTQQFSFKEDSLKDFLQLPFEDQNRNEVNEFLMQRFSLEGKDTKVYFKNEDSENEFILPNRSELPGKVFVAYPNVLWDGNIAERDTLFKSIREWIIMLLEHFKQNNNHSLIIRFHPAETTWLSGSVTFESTLNDYLKDIHLFNNIKIISSSSRISSYKLLDKFSDYTLVYDGFIALESPFFGVPVLFSGSGRFNVQGYGLQFETVEDYFDFISRPNDIYNLDIQKELAEKLIYYYLFYNAYYFPVLDNLEDDYSTDPYIFYRSNIDFEQSLKSIMEGFIRCL
jgi:hypothetical protein